MGYIGWTLNKPLVDKYMFKIKTVFLHWVSACRQISLWILSEFDRINLLIFPTKSSKIIGFLMISGRIEKRLILELNLGGGCQKNAAVSPPIEFGVKTPPNICVFHPYTSLKYLIFTSYFLSFLKNVCLFLQEIQLLQNSV